MQLVFLLFGMLVAPTRSQDLTSGNLSSIVAASIGGAAGSASGLFSTALQSLIAMSNATLDNSPYAYHAAHESARIPHSYMVKLKSSVDASLAAKIWSLLDLIDGVTVEKSLSRVFAGSVITVPGELPVDLFKKLPWIEYIQEASVWRTAQVQSLGGDRNKWGLDRIDQAKLPLDKTYTFSLTGKGANIYIVDSGVDVSHSEFLDIYGNGRAKTVYVTPALQATGGFDCTGHGTHVAGIAGGTNVGVAKEANIFSVRIIGCDDNSQNTAVVMALDWIIDNHQSPAIINMSLGPKSAGDTIDPSVSAAVASAIAAGITVIVAAGNGINGVGVNACSTAPAGSPGSITVGASNSIDYRASFSNFGSCLALFAPGVDISSAKPGGGFAIKSGTSQATPFVSGVAALQFERAPSTSPSQMLQALQGAAVQNAIFDNRGSPNYLLQSVYVPQKGSDEAARPLVALMADTTPGMSTTQMIGYALIGFGSIALVGIAFFVVRRLRRRKSGALSPKSFSSNSPKSPPAHRNGNGKQKAIKPPLPAMVAINPLQSHRTENVATTKPPQKQQQLVNARWKTPFMPPPGTPVMDMSQPSVSRDVVRPQQPMTVVPKPTIGARMIKVMPHKALGPAARIAGSPVRQMMEHRPEKVAPRPMNIPSPARQTPLRAAARPGFSPYSNQSQMFSDVSLADNAYKTIEPLSLSDEIYAQIRNEPPVGGHKRGYYGDRGLD